MMDSRSEPKRPVLDALLAGDRGDALALLEAAPDDALALARIYQRRLQPALAEIGRLWETSRITVAEEHLASALVESVLETQYAHLLHVPRVGNRAVVACPPREWHQIGAKMVANILEACGWDTHFLGASTPAADLQEFTANRKIQLVALSSVLPEFAPAACSLVRELVQSQPGLSIVVGGSAINESLTKDLTRLSGSVHVCEDLESFQAALTSGTYL